jgi:hypothetical protein
LLILHICWWEPMSFWTWSEALGMKRGKMWRLLGGDFNTFSQTWGRNHSLSPIPTQPTPPSMKVRSLLSDLTLLSKYLWCLCPYTMSRWRWL